MRFLNAASAALAEDGINLSTGASGPGAEVLDVDILHWMGQGASIAGNRG